MSIIRFTDLIGPELSDFNIQMPSTAHLNINGTYTQGANGQFCLPSGTTLQRPSNPQVGMIRINETLLAIEVYDGSDWVILTAPQGGAGSGETTVTGQEAYTSSGSFNWECPDNVYSVCVVCVGAGGGSTRDEQGAGGGGGLGWKNDIAVQPGETYSVVVGARGTPANPGNYAGNGGDSYFIDTQTCRGQGGGGTGRDNNGNANRAGYGGEGGGYGASATATGTTGGGYGGNGGDGNRSSLSDTGSSCGGGGAGGYTGNGGNGGHCGQYAGGNSGWSGSGGGGGGGWTNGGENYGGGGGGVGLMGEGSSGSSSSNNCGGGYGGSGGANGTGSCSGDQQTPGGNYGGGAGANDQGGWVGGTGAVRIIWGPGRSFPSTGTGNQ